MAKPNRLILQDDPDDVRRKIDYYPGPVATEAHESDARVKLAWGPLGTAKTTWLCWRIAFKAQRAAHHHLSLRAILVRDTYRNLADSTLQTFLHWFPESGAEGPGVGKKVQSMPVDFKLWMGCDCCPDTARFHDVLFRHGQTEQDASMFLSTEYDFIGLEEVAPAYIPGLKKISPGIAEGVFDMALGRLTREKERAKRIGPELAITCNSPPLTHWASKRIIDKPAAYLSQPALNWGQWMFPTSDNMANLRDDYYTSLEAAWEGKRGLIQRFIKGERLPIFVGIPRFNLDQLDRMRGACAVPPFRGFLRSTDENVLSVKLEVHHEGFVKMWEPPDLKKQYAIGADVAEGIEGGDYSAAYVIDRETLDIVCAFHGHVEPEMFGQELAMLGYLYNKASVGVESNNHGLTTLTKLRNLNYQNIFYNKNLELRGRGQERIGFRTDRKSKPMLIDGIAAHFEIEPGQKDQYIPDAELISELQTYGMFDDGTTGAQDGCFDDRVMAYGIALFMSKISGISRYFPSLN